MQSNALNHKIIILTPARIHNILNLQ